MDSPDRAVPVDVDRVEGQRNLVTTGRRAAPWEHSRSELSAPLAREGRRWAGVLVGRSDLVVGERAAVELAVPPQRLRKSGATARPSEVSVGELAPRCGRMGGRGRHVHSPAATPAG